MAGKRDLQLASLFFTIESRSKGLQGELQAAERSFGRFTKFVRANPVAAIGGLAAAAVAAGIAAAKMAEQFDSAVRKIAATIPEGTARLGDLKRAADQLSTSKGLSADVVLSGLAAIGKEGVTSIEALVARFEALQKVADATGTEVAALAGPFDQVLDVFGLADSELQRVGATLAAISQERGVGFEDLLGAFQSAAPVIRETGLSFDEGAAAISRLLAEGLSAKQVTAELKDQVKSLGRDGMRALASETRDAAKDLGDLEERARAVEESMERTRGAIDAEFASATKKVGALINENILIPLGQGSKLLVALALGGKAASAEAQGLLAAMRAAIPGFGSAPRVDADGGFNVGSGTGLGEPLPPPPARRPPPPPTPEELKRLRDQVADTFTDTLPTTIEATVVAIGEMGRQLLALGTPVGEVRQQLKPLTDELGRIMEASERLRDQERGADLSATTDHIEEIVDLYDTALEQRLAILDAERAATVEQANQATEAETIVRLQARLAAYDAQILRLRRQQAEASGEVQEFLEGSVPPVKEIKDTAADLGRQLESLARGAIGFAQALGIADDQAAALLQNVITIGQNLPKALSGDLTAIGGLLGGLAGVVSSLFGESADSRRDREIREQNTEAIRELTKTFRDQVAGSTVTGAQSAVEALLAAGPRVRGVLPFAPINRDAANDIIGGLGIPGVENLRDLRDLLKEIDPGLQLNTSSLDDFTDSLKQVQRALEEVNFRAFAETFAGQLSLLQLQFDLLDLTNPLDQLARLQELAAGTFGSPALEAALAGLDLTDPAQRAEAERRLLDLANRAGLDSASGGFTAADLGGMSTQELLDFIRTFEGLIDAVNADAATADGGSSRSFAEENRITETTGQRLAGIAESQLAVQRDILAALTGTFVPVMPPPIAGLVAAGSAPGGFSVTIGDVSVQFMGPVGDPLTAGQQVAAVTVDTIDRLMGQAIQRRLAQLGRV